MDKLDDEMQPNHEPPLSSPSHGRHRPMWTREIPKAAIGWLVSTLLGSALTATITATKANWRIVGPILLAVLLLLAAGYLGYVRMRAELRFHERLDNRFGPGSSPRADLAILGWVLATSPLAVAILLLFLFALRTVEKLGVSIATSLRVLVIFVCPIALVFTVLLMRDLIRDWRNRRAGQSLAP